MYRLRSYRPSYRYCCNNCMCIWSTYIYIYIYLYLYAHCLLHVINNSDNAIISYYVHIWHFQVTEIFEHVFVFLFLFVYDAIILSSCMKDKCYKKCSRAFEFISFFPSFQNGSVFTILTRVSFGSRRESYIRCAIVACGINRYLATMRLFNFLINNNHVSHSFHNRIILLLLHTYGKREQRRTFN